MILRKIFKNTSKFPDSARVARKTFFCVVDIVNDFVRGDEVIELKKISLCIDDRKRFFKEISFSFIRIFFFFIEDRNENL